MPSTGHGKNAVVKLDDRTAALIAITSVVAESGFEYSTDTDGANVYGLRGEDHTIGLVENGTCGLSGPYGTTYFRQLAGVWHSTSATQTLELNPRGTVTGSRKHTAETIMTGVELSWDIGSTVGLSSEHKVTGVVTAADN